jgi:chemotaxis protein histidine kinase CheA
VGLGVAVLALAGPSVPIAAADEGPSIPVAVDAASAALDAALESASAVSTADAAPQDPVAAVVEELTQPPATEDEATEPVTAPGPVEAAPAESLVPTTPQPDAPVVPETTATAPEPSATAETGDTTTQSTATEPLPEETAAETAATEEPAAAPEAPAATAAQVQPVNLNVSIRIDSPGDNGAVTQVNAAVADADAQYQPDATQYHAPEAESTTPAPSAPAPDTAAEEPTAAPNEGGWTWTLTCGGFTQQLAPAGILPANWTWNWNWNCGSPEGASPNSDSQNGGQYQAGVMQYQPVNLNVSIRIGSPGNDGPVTQTNIAVAVVVPPVALPVIPLPVVTIPSTTSPVFTTPVVVTTDSPSASSQPETAALIEVGITAEIVAEYDTALAAWIFAGAGRTFVVQSSPAPFGAQSAAARPLPPAASVRSATYRQLRTATSVSRGPSATAYAVAARPHATARDARAAGGGSKQHDRKRPLPPRRAPLLASGLAAAAPAGGADGGWPFLALLLVPFAFALVDRAGRAAREAGSPADAELSSRRERPG